MTKRISSAQDARRGPTYINIGTYLQQERYLHKFFSKLNAAGITTLADLYDYSPEELFKIAPTSKNNQKRFLSYAKDGTVTLAPK